MASPPSGIDLGLVIVTGASSGIGAELARQLSMAGRPVLAVARRADRLQGLATEAASTGRGPIHPLAVDLTQERAAEQIRDRARSLGGATWLINNAGLAIFGGFLETPADDHRRQIRLNIEAVVTLTAAIAPDLVARGGGRIVNIASTAGFQPTPYIAVYGGTKAFVLSWSEALSEELRARNVTVTAVCPGPVDTEIFSVGAPGVARKKVAGELSAEQVAKEILATARNGRTVRTLGLFNATRAVLAQVAPRGLVRRISANLGVKSVGLDAGATRGGGARG